jgi:SPP1 family phage portal protein
MTIQKIQLSPGERLTEKQIKDYISNHDPSEFHAHKEYWKGKNTKIEERSEDPDYTSDDHTINNIVPVPHARKIAQTVVGYAFKPGSITYTSQNQGYLDLVKDVFEKNDEEAKTAKNGLYMSSRGISYELQYTTLDESGKAQYRFAIVEPSEVIPLNNYDIEPQLVCVIRYYTRTVGEKDVIYTDVYYTDVIQYFMIDGDKITPREEEEFTHLMGGVPWVIYYNNDELDPDYWAVKELIDIYDVLISDSMNEFEKFAYAYLRLVNFRLKDEDKEKFKQLRVFEDLPEKDAVTYLTKDINTDFIGYMTKLVEDLIFKYAHVYDPTDENFSGVASGIALKYKLFDMETNLVSFKESYHRSGLKRRLMFLGNYFQLKSIETEKIEIHYKRNIPNNLVEISEIAAKLKGILSDPTILSLFPSDIVKDVAEELKKIEQGRASQEKINLETLEDM